MLFWVKTTKALSSRADKTKTSFSQSEMDRMAALQPFVLHSFWLRQTIERTVKERDFNVFTEQEEIGYLTAMVEVGMRTYKDIVNMDKKITWSKIKDDFTDAEREAILNFFFSMASVFAFSMFCFLCKSSTFICSSRG